MPEKMLARAGATPLSNQLAATLTGKEILDLNPDGYHYTRLIAGHPHEKIIYGFVKMDPALAQKLEKLNITVHS